MEGGRWENERETGKLLCSGKRQAAAAPTNLPSTLPFPLSLYSPFCYRATHPAPLSFSGNAARQQSVARGRKQTLTVSPPPLPTASKRATVPTATSGKGAVNFKTGAHAHRARGVGWGRGGGGRRGRDEGTTPAQQAVVKLLELREEGGGPLEGEFGGNDRRKGNAEAERELDKRVWVRTKGQHRHSKQWSSY